ncbi:endodeoxyribonuclease RusA [Pseudoalteromonas sp. SW0106-04]|nr:endodeoxyribonuclease RusA [Pseudoalteromonas sp. SW0106-04]
MSQRDKWKKRPVVVRYFAYKDQCRLQGVALPTHGYHITFVLPMPKSWSKKKRMNMLGQPHLNKPDKDNLEKALLDAIFEEDSVVWDGRVTKLWGEEGQIIVGEC